MAEVIEHLEKPHLVLLECNRVLSDDGILVVSVPYKEKIGYQICIHCNKPTPTHSHLHTFTPDSLIELINQSGFKLIKMSKYLNKVLNRLHLNLMLKSWPLYSWKAIDKIFNMIIDKPTSMIVWCKKIIYTLTMRSTGRQTDWHELVI